VSNCQSFIDEHSDQPAVKFTFILEMRSRLRCFQPAIFDGIVGPFSAAENATCKEA
jgi:hypothetical protein